VLGPRNTLLQDPARPASTCDDRDNPLLSLLPVCSRIA
jgi:hypothetical protein